MLFVSYLAGGYVAGRMARFSGLEAGCRRLAVGDHRRRRARPCSAWCSVPASTCSANLDAFPRIPLFGDDTDVAGIITAVVFAVIALVGAILGGHAGMRYHRRVDRAGETVVDDTLPVE